MFLSFFSSESSLVHHLFMYGQGLLMGTVSVSTSHMVSTNLLTIISNSSFQQIFFTGHCLSRMASSLLLIALKSVMAMLYVGNIWAPVIGKVVCMQGSYVGVYIADGDMVCSIAFMPNIVWVCPV